jgi:NAD(P)-dependent dehydrogenase (short-subunit alcohol dehydrogenase family)
MSTKQGKDARLDRRSVLVGGAAMLAAFIPRSGYPLLITAEGDAPKSSPSGGGTVPLMLEGKTALVTGSTDGLGKAVALKLAEMGAQVLVHGRNAERGNALAEAIKRDTAGCAGFYSADLASLADVRKLAEAIRTDIKQIDILINNAGIGSTNSSGSKQREVSVEGYELRFAVNYLSGYLLTRMLLPTLTNSAPARIVNVASLAQNPIDFNNVMLERDYDGGRAYGQSKLAQIMFTQDLAEELAGKGVTANSLHPATYMDTSMVRSAGVQPRSTVEEGANAVVYLATSPDLKDKSGLFFNGKRQMKANAQAYDPQARAQLKALSEKWVKPRRNRKTERRYWP